MASHDSDCPYLETDDLDDCTCPEIEEIWEADDEEDDEDG